MKYFEESEFSNFEMMDSKLLSMLDEMREKYGDSDALDKQFIDSYVNR